MKTKQTKKEFIVDTEHPQYISERVQALGELVKTFTSLKQTELLRKYIHAVGKEHEQSLDEIAQEVRR